MRLWINVFKTTRMEQSRWKKQDDYTLQSRLFRLMKFLYWKMNDTVYRQKPLKRSLGENIHGVRYFYTAYFLYRNTFLKRSKYKSNFNTINLSCKCFEITRSRSSTTCNSRACYLRSTRSPHPRPSAFLEQVKRPLYVFKSTRNLTYKLKNFDQLNCSVLSRFFFIFSKRKFFFFILFVGRILNVYLFYNFVSSLLYIRPF